MLGRREFSAKRVVIEGDSALGPRCDYKAYLDSWDDKHLDLIPGEQPTWWTIRQLSEDQKRAIHPLQGFDRAMLTIRCILQGVDGYVIEGVDGVRRAPAPLEFEDAGELGRVVKVSSVKALGLLREHWFPLYNVGTLFSEASLPFSKPSAAESGAHVPST